MAADIVTVTAPGTHALEAGTAAFGTLRYTLDLPAGLSPDKPVPLILALHYGFDPNAPFPAYYGRGVLEGLVAPALGGLGAILVAPDSHGQRWTAPDLGGGVLELLDALAASYPVDPARTAVTGYSLGGIGTWHLIGADPGRFRAGISVSARPEPADVARYPEAVPLCVIHSRRDEIFALGDVTASVDALRERGVPVELRTVEDATHFDVGAFVEPLRRAVPWLEAAWSGG